MPKTIVKKLVPIKEMDQPYSKNFQHFSELQEILNKNPQKAVLLNMSKKTVYAGMITSLYNLKKLGMFPKLKIAKREKNFYAYLNK